MGAVLCLSSCAKKVAYQMVKPLPAPYEVNKLQDATVPATFSSKDISWESGKLHMEVFSEDLYDAVAVSQLKNGDTVICDGKPVVVKVLPILMIRSYCTNYIFEISSIISFILFMAFLIEAL